MFHDIHLQHFKQWHKLQWNLFLCLVVVLLPIYVSAAATDWQDQPVTLEFSKEPLQKVLEKFCEQAGFSIVFDESLANELVTGDYDDITAVDALNRIFKGKNKIIQVNNDQKILVVKTFGAKKFVWAGGEDTSKSITLEELKTMHIMQSQELAENFADPNQVLDLGMTRAELHTMHEQQYNEYMSSIRNEAELFDEGITRGQMKLIHEKQFQAYQNSLTNKDEKLIGGITREQLNALNEQQYQEYKKESSDVDTIVDGLDMTYRQLSNLHQQQYAELSENAANKSIPVDF